MDDQDMDDQDVIAAFDAAAEEEDEEDDEIDVLARFVESQDTELQLGHTDSLNDDDDKNKKRRERLIQDARGGQIQGKQDKKGD